MAARSDHLRAAVQELKRVLTERTARGGCQRTAELDRALATLEDAMRKHVGTLNAPDALIPVPELPRLPSPTVDRRAGQLGAELEQFLRELRELREQAPPPGQDATDYGALYERAWQLADDLAGFEQKEASLILETVNTDLGAGE
jgi:hypothetical protein